MARGRMLNKRIGQNREVDLLIDACGYRAGLFYTWMIAHADKEGRVHGDPSVLRAMVVPRRLDDFTVEAVEKILTEAHRLKLILWYTVRGERWIWFPRFERNQPGLRKDKERPSSIPSPSPDLVRQWQRDENDGDGCEPVIASDESTRVDGTTPEGRRDDGVTTAARRTDDGEGSGTREGKVSEEKVSEGKAAAASPAAPTFADPVIERASLAILNCYPADQYDRINTERVITFVEGMRAECPSVDIASAAHQAKQWQVRKGRDSKDPISFLRNWIRRENGDGPNSKSNDAPAPKAKRQQSYEELVAQTNDLIAEQTRRHGE